MTSFDKLPFDSRYGGEALEAWHSRLAAMERLILNQGGDDISEVFVETSGDDLTNVDMGLVQQNGNGVFVGFWLSFGGFTIQLPC